MGATFQFISKSFEVIFNEVEAHDELSHCTHSLSSVVWQYLQDCDLSPPVSSEDGFPGLVDIAETDHVWSLWQLETDDMWPMTMSAPTCVPVTSPWQAAHHTSHSDANCKQYAALFYLLRRI